MFLIAWALAEAPLETLEGCPATTAELPASSLFRADDARFARDDVIVVLKEARRLMVYDRGALATRADGGPACWRVALGSGYPPGHKQRMGDMRTPEGWYATSDRPWSVFYGAISMHYPSAADAERGLASGLISEAQAEAIREAEQKGAVPPAETKLGGKIVIHGGGSTMDWTLGCIALDDPDIDALREILPKSMRTRILVLP